MHTPSDTDDILYRAPLERGVRRKCFSLYPAAHTDLRSQRKHERAQNECVWHAPRVLSFVAAAVDFHGAIDVSAGHCSTRLPCLSRRVFRSNGPRGTVV